MASQKSRVLDLYKNLLYMGRDYPLGYNFFRLKCRSEFLKNRNETNPVKIKQMIAYGKYTLRELEALYKLRKYRTLKQRYYLEREGASEIEKFVNMIEKKDQEPYSRTNDTLNIREKSIGAWARDIPWPASIKGKY